MHVGLCSAAPLLSLLHTALLGPPLLLLQLLRVTVRLHHLPDPGHRQQVEVGAIQVGAQVAVHVHPVVLGSRKQLAPLVQFGVILAHRVVTNLERTDRRR